MAVFEGPGMVSGVILVPEVETVAVPGKIGFVFGHRLFENDSRGICNGANRLGLG